MQTVAIEQKREFTTRALAYLMKPRPVEGLNQSPWIRGERRSPLWDSRLLQPLCGLLFPSLHTALLFPGYPHGESGPPSASEFTAYCSREQLRLLAHFPDFQGGSLQHAHFGWALPQRVSWAREGWSQCRRWGSAALPLPRRQLGSCRKAREGKGHRTQCQVPLRQGVPLHTL